MKIYFDTEFTGLHKNTTLISIGLIDDDGRTFYAELNDYDKSQCNDWIQENVIKHLVLPKTGCISYDENDTWCNVRGNKETVKNELKRWLSKYDTVQLVSDVCHYDMVLFIDLFGGAFDIPENLCPACHDINQDIAKFYKMSEADAFDYSREEIIGDSVEGDKHNALYDAKVIRAISWKINGR